MAGPSNLIYTAEVARENCLDARRVLPRLIEMSERIKRWRKVRKRRSHQYLKNPPLLFFPVGLVIISLIIFCLFIYYVSTHRIKLDWLY